MRYSVVSSARLVTAAASHYLSVSSPVPKPITASWPVRGSNSSILTVARAAAKRKITHFARGPETWVILLPHRFGAEPHG